MNLIKSIGGLRQDLTSQTKKNGLKLTGINIVFFILLLLLGTLLLVIILNKLSFFNNYTDSLYSFKSSYQQTGIITNSQGSMLVDFYDALKEAFFSSIFLIFAFIIFYGFLRGLKTIFLQKILFNKKLPKKHLLFTSVYNFMFGFVFFLLFVSVLLVVTNPYAVLILWFLIFVLLESLVYSFETKFLFKKKFFLDLFLEHVLFNLVTSVFFTIGALVVMILSSLMGLINPLLTFILIPILLFLLYLKRDIMLYLVVNYIEDVKK